ncbi:MAG: hypothetical protein H0Z38_08290, partial [Firmicutes bacterium]|nr:hypothetical protein [Bacillota bacterium]
IITAWRHRGKLEQQELLFPEALHLAPAEYDELWAARDWLAKLGYTLEEFGTNSLVVRSVPVVLGNKNSHGALKETLLELAATYEANLEENRELDALWQAAAITACRGAIKAGDVLEPAQAIGLIKDWLALGVPTCPHGRPIIKRFDGEALAKMFARS